MFTTLNKQQLFLQCLRLSIITIKNFCVLYKMKMHLFTICICNENLTFFNNYAFLIRVCNIKFSFTSEFIKHLISCVLKDVMIAIVQIKTRNFCFRNFNFNAVTTSIRLELSCFFLAIISFFLLFNVFKTRQIVRLIFFLLHE